MRQRLKPQVCTRTWGRFFFSVRAWRVVDRTECPANRAAIKGAADLSFPALRHSMSWRSNRYLPKQLPNSGRGRHMSPIAQSAKTKTAKDRRAAHGTPPIADCKLIPESPHSGNERSRPPHPALGYSP